MKLWLGLVLTVCLAWPVYAQNEDTNIVEVIAQDEIEARAKDVGHLLRCVVCQNQSIEESDASLAEDMRRLVRARIARGDSDDEVIAFMHERYGDFVLLKPPIQSNTYLLWFLPFLLTGAGLVWFAIQKRQEFSVDDIKPLTESEKKQIKSL